MIYIGRDKASNQVELSTISEKAVKTHTHTEQAYYHITRTIFFMSVSFFMSDMP